MAKGWITIRTDRVAALPKVEVTKKAKTASKLINATKSLDFEKLKKEGDKAYTDNIAREESILTAAADNRLRSKSLKKEAIAIQKKRNGKKENAAKDKVN